MSTNSTPRLGAIVHYTLSESDARQVRQERIAAGAATRRGNDALEGDTYPAMIVRDWAYSPETARSAAERSLVPAPDGHDPNPLVLDELTDEEIRAEASRLRELSANTASVNLQVFLDGTDTLWVTSRSEFDPSQHGAFVADAPQLALPGFVFEYDRTAHTQEEFDAAQAVALREYEAGVQKLEAEHRARYWREDRRGHWFPTPTTW